MPIFPLKKKLDNQKKSSGLLSFFIQFGLVAVLFFAIGFSLGQKKIGFIEGGGIAPKISVENKTPTDQNVDFSLFWQVFDAIPNTYFDKSAVDGQKMMYGAISGMVRSLGDPYTAFLDPKQNEAIKSELAGSYEGVGVEIGFNKEKRLAVIAPLADTPAEKARILPKDLILKIGDKDTFDITLPEAVDLIRGRAGTSVKFILLHDGETEPYEVEIVREKITVRSVVLTFKETNGKKIGVVKVSRFGDTTDADWDEAVNKIQLEGAGGVVVDLRNNPGGLLNSSIHLASDFVSGTIVKQEFADGSIKSLNADHTGKLLKIPMVVIINGGSASASEIFAGAVQDAKRGKIVGEQSFGKGTVQDALNLPGGAGLHVTIARWLTPKGKWIHEAGIKPDVEIKATKEDVSADVDLLMDGALELF